MNTPLFPPVPRKSAAETVRAQLVELIESGRLPVDSQLPSENELAQSFGVSRPVVREALVSLAALGFIKSKTGRGTFVASSRVTTPLLLGQYSPAHLNEVRRVLEVPSARIAAVRRTEEDLGRLAEILARLEDSEDTHERNKCDASFHVAIAQATGNPLFVKLIEELRQMLEELSRAASSVPERRHDAISEHRAMYDAIVRRDPDGAARAMAAHVEAVDNTFVQLEAGAKQDSPSPVAPVQAFGTLTEAAPAVQHATQEPVKPRRARPPRSS